MKVLARGSGAKEAAIMQLLKSREGVGSANIIQFYEAFNIVNDVLCLVFEVMWTNAKDFCDPFHDMPVKERLIRRVGGELFKAIAFLKRKGLLHNGK